MGIALHCGRSWERCTYIYPVNRFRLLGPSTSSQTNAHGPSPRIVLCCIVLYSVKLVSSPLAWEEKKLIAFLSPADPKRGTLTICSSVRFSVTTSLPPLHPHSRPQLSTHTYTAQPDVVRSKKDGVRVG
jgi:hypothetical protein